MINQLILEEISAFMIGFSIFCVLGSIAIIIFVIRCICLVMDDKENYRTKEYKYSQYNKIRKKK